MKSMKKQGSRCWSAAAMLVILLAALILPSSAAAATGKISGIVKDSSGNLFQAVDVYVARVYDDHTNVEEWNDFTDEYGTYTATIDLQPGELGYKVLFKKEGYINQWYNNAPQVDCAEPVALTDGGDRKIDVVLKEGINSISKKNLAEISPTVVGAGGTISGHVTLNGTAFKCAQVMAYKVENSSYLIGMGLVFADYKGDYTISDLELGSYKIVFYDQNGNPQWYNRKADVACADTVSETASGINAAFPVSLRQCGDRPTILPAIKLLLN